MTTIEEAHIEKNANPMHLLLDLHFLKVYPTDKKLTGIFPFKSKNTVAKWVRIYVRKLQLLKSEKVSGRLMPII